MLVRVEYDPYSASDILPFGYYSSMRGRSVTGFVRPGARFVDVLFSLIAIVSGISRFFEVR